uniref:DDE Tnp4 domain-containing protein n=1 Tax=Anopheles minimus TaxID=112268 RepID=A0A182VPM2_9DIPT
MNTMRRRRVMALMRNWWMRPIFIQRNEAGNRLLAVLMEEQFAGATLNFLRMTKSDFDQLLSLIGPFIKRQDTNMRPAITVPERLLITLRYLATGESYTSLQYLFRVSQSACQEDRSVVLFRKYAGPWLRRFDIMFGTPYPEAVPYVLLGDKAFAMTDYLIRPFAGLHAPGSKERLFNQRHSKARSTIENVFGILSNRFRVLVGPIELEPNLAKQIVLATVYVHNFLRTRQTMETPMSVQVAGDVRDVSLQNETSTNITGLAGVRIRSSNDLMLMRMRFANHFFNS